MIFATQIRQIVKRDVLLCALFTAAGGMLAFAQRLIHIGPVTVDKPGFPEWLRMYDRAASAVSSWPWNLVLGIVLVTSLIQLRFKTPSWALAFGLGGLLGIIVANSI